MKHLLTLLLVLWMTGCASSAPMPAPATPTSIPTSTSTPEPKCSAENTPNFADYATWMKVNPKPIKGHETFVNIYVDDDAKDVYLSASGETFPECAMIVKTHLQSKDSENLTAVTVMVKMPAGYDPENNNWWWGMYDKDGKVAEMSGKVDVCIACHKPAATTDYVFSQKVMEEINK
jgi:hypothetical protein